MHCPLLSFSGETDQGTPPSEVEQLRRTLEAAGKQSELHIYPGVPAISVRRRSMPGVVCSPFSGATWRADTHSCAVAAIGSVRSPASYGAKRRRCRIREPSSCSLDGTEKLAMLKTAPQQFSRGTVRAIPLSVHSPPQPEPVPSIGSGSPLVGVPWALAHHRTVNQRQARRLSHERERAARKENFDTTRHAPDGTMHAADCCVGCTQEAIT